MTWRNRVSLIVLAIALGPSGLLNARQANDAAHKQAQGGPQSPQAGTSAKPPNQSAFHRQVSSTAVLMSAKHDVSRPLREIAPLLVDDQGEPHEPLLIHQAKRKTAQLDPA